MMKMTLEFLESDAEGRSGLLLLQHGVRPVLQIRVRGVEVKGVSLGKCTEKVSRMPSSDTVCFHRKQEVADES